jgi:hypothetical protein
MMDNFWLRFLVMANGFSIIVCLLWTTVTGDRYGASWSVPTFFAIGAGLSYWWCKYVNPVEQEKKDGD